MKSLRHLHRPLRIYLAGKIEPAGWRDCIVEGLRDVAYNGNPLDLETHFDESGLSPYLPYSIFGIHDYTGPFFVGCDHCCYHGNNSHGAMTRGTADCNPTYSESLVQVYGYKPHESYLVEERAVFEMCLNGVKYADLVFAWIESQDCFGTLFELGYAHALSKPIGMYAPHRTPDLWFAGRSSQLGRIDRDFKLPDEALRHFLREVYRP